MELGMQPFRVGTMDEVIYAAKGSFDDWAYAVGRYPSVVTHCQKQSFEPYPKGMASGLIFLLELGPQNSKLLGS